MNVKKRREDLMTTWLERMQASVAAGDKPAYGDLEEGLLNTMAELDATKEVLRQVTSELARIVTLRVKDNTPGMLAAVDDFIKRKVVVKPAESKELH